MGAWLGPRWNEAIGLRRCDLNPLRQELTFGRVVVNQNGSRTYTERFSKTEDFRTVPVPQPVMDRLLEHVARYCPGGDRDEFLFLTRNGTHPLRANVARDVLAPGRSARAGSAARHLAHAAAHRRVPHVRRRPDDVRGAAAPRAQEPDDDRRGLHAPHARALRGGQVSAWRSTCSPSECRRPLLAANSSVPDTVDVLNARATLKLRCAGLGRDSGSPYRVP